MPTQAQQSRFSDLNQKLILFGKDNADAKLRIRDELMRAMRVGESSASETGELLYVSYIMRDFAKICTFGEFLVFSEAVVLSDNYRAEMRVDLLRLLGYEFRDAYSADDLKPLLSKAVRLDNDALRDAAIRMLTGWSFDSVEVSPVSMDEGIKALKELVAKHESFETQQPYLEKLARLGHGRHAYVDHLREKIANKEIPVAQRYEFAKKLLKWDAFLVQELEKEMGLFPSKSGTRVIKAGRR